jgi:hypothetical protein
MSTDVAQNLVGDMGSRGDADDVQVSLDEVAAARAVLDRDGDALEAARQQARDVIAARETHRQQLHAAIVKALREGARVTAVAGAAGYTREQVRRVARAGGIEAE